LPRTKSIGHCAGFLIGVGALLPASG